MKEIVTYILFLLSLPPISFILFSFLLRRPHLKHSETVQIPTLTTFGAFSLQGLRPTNEDAHITQKSQNSLVSGVFDGHAGSAASKFCKRNILQELTDDYWPIRIDTRFLADAGIRGLVDGTTACVVKLHKNQIKTWNIGDSRAVLARNGTEINLSNDFKPELEIARIYAAGGVVQPFSTISENVILQQGPKRIYPGGLSVSRGIGDINFKNLEYLESLGCSSQLVSCYPEISQIKISKNDHFIVIGCDGLWDVFTSQEVIQIVYVLICLLFSTSNYAKSLLLPLGVNQEKMKRENAAQIIASLLCQFAIKAGSTDNVSVVINMFEEQIREIDANQCVSEMEFSIGRILSFEDIIVQYCNIQKIICKNQISEDVKNISFKEINEQDIKFWRLAEDPSLNVEQLDQGRKKLWTQMLNQGIRMSDVRNTPNLTGFIENNEKMIYEIVDQDQLM
ncbi:Serine/threonine-protein phosphatase 2C [Spironucleus salmonicida]|uniref:Serine/threonine-protein phosphatase 2C n=1 Tax=Spironucleus salmonicida TaxID=348837 RepID=V6LYQ2_9EUKA|nr:Serine/threonine-protein phosphatase 2C [Spironucleus salmonicida]|eukprot:EST45954.1 Serine/threonine-protein phosphatase 2C [Spironucleus salmonicida]